MNSHPLGQWTKPTTRSKGGGLGLGPRWLGAGLDHWCRAIASSLLLWLWLPGVFLLLRPRLRLREFWLWLLTRRLRELWLRLPCLQLRQLRLRISGVLLRLWRRLLSADLSLRLLPMVAIDQPTVPPSTEAIGSPAALRSTALVGAEPLVRKQVAYAKSSRTVGFSFGHGPV